ncbi:hypothetical protein C8R45DRAFT_937302 [Mycena sanguinolenta]|nr:hypothetical protein C8R45DRAFT_937302 [Mycena sanguinolenta]
MALYKCHIGDYSTAELFAIEAKQIVEVAVNLHQSAFASHIQAGCARSLGNYPDSVMHLLSARKRLEICGLSRGYTDHITTASQAEIYLLKSEYTEAQKNVWGGLNKVTEIASMLGLPAIKAVLELREHKFDLAGINFQECLHVVQGLEASIEAVCLEHLANIRVWPATRLQSRWPLVYLSFAFRSKDNLALHKTLLFLGDILIANNDGETAFALYTVALEGFTQMDVHQSRAQCMLRLGDLAHKHGDAAAAIVHWNTARPLFERSLQANDVIQIDSRLAALEKAHDEALDELAILEAATESLNEVAMSDKQEKRLFPCDSWKQFQCYISCYFLY